MLGVPQPAGVQHIPLQQERLPPDMPDLPQPVAEAAPVPHLQGAISSHTKEEPFGRAGNCLMVDSKSQNCFARLLKLALSFRRWRIWRNQLLHHKVLSHLQPLLCPWVPPCRSVCLKRRRWNWQFRNHKRLEIFTMTDTAIPGVFLNFPK